MAGYGIDVEATVDEVLSLTYGMVSFTDVGSLAESLVKVLDDDLLSVVVEEGKTSPAVESIYALLWGQYPGREATRVAAVATLDLFYHLCRDDELAELGSEAIYTGPEFVSFQQRLEEKRKAVAE